MQPVTPEPRYLPMPSLDMTDPGAQVVSGVIGVADTAQRVAGLRLASKQVPKSREARLRLAAALTDAGEFPEAADILKALGEEDPWDWRVLWFQARMHLSQGQPAEARKLFDQVYFDVPGEIAPKLALGLAAEMEGNCPLAAKMYDLVSRTDPGFVSAVFGLARCQNAANPTNARKGAVDALQRIPPSSALYLRSRVAAARVLVGQESTAPALGDLAAASAVAETLGLSGLSKATLDTHILTAAVQGLDKRAFAATQGLKILGEPVEERRLRLKLESSLRSMAHFASGPERIQLVDQANAVRPRTLL